VKRIILILITAIIVSACSDSNFIIEGKITNSSASTIYLDKLEIDGSVPFDSSRIDKNGNFKLEGSVGFPTFFLLKLNNQKIITLLIDSLEQINFSADYLNFSRDYKVEGSQGSEKVKILNDRLTQTNTKIDSLKSLISICLDNPNYAEKRDEWMHELDEVYTSQQDFSKRFIEENPFSMASVLAIYQKFNDGEYVLQDLQTLKMASSALHSMYPSSIHAQTLYRDTEKLVQEIRAIELREFVSNHGSNSPEISLPDYKGDTIDLSMLRGKTVLLHFWSASDRTSRVMNELLSENYKLFNNKGFEIYQVSIDTERDLWMQAIEDDNLNWINVGDMNGSLKAVNSYNINKVPSNYLLGPDGSILAKDLKGPALHRKLNEILN
jgi:peroxiredoxin